MGEGLPRIEPRVDAVVTGQGSLQTLTVEFGGTPRGAVLVVSDTGRLRFETVEVLNEFAAHGYISLAFDPAGQGARRTDDEALADVAWLLRELRARGWTTDQLAIVGYGTGGRAALLAAVEWELGAAVSVAPTGVGIPVDGYPALTDLARPVWTPWLGLLSERDPQAPADAVNRLSAILTSSPVHAQLVTYGGATTQFHRDSGDVRTHAACFDSWQRTVEWISLRVAPPPTPLAERWARASTEGAQS